MKSSRLLAAPRSAALTLAMATLALMFAPPPAGAEVTEFHLDPYHSDAIVLVEHFGVSRQGGIFGKLAGTVKVDPQDWTGWSIDVTIPVFEFLATHAPRAEAVKGPQFLDAKNFPEIHFKSDKVEKNGDQFVATGALTIRDVTKEVTVPLKILGPRSDPFGGFRIGIEGTVVVRRSEFGITFDRKLPDEGPVLGEEVTIQLCVEAMKSGGMIKKPE